MKQFCRRCALIFVLLFSFLVDAQSTKPKITTERPVVPKFDKSSWQTYRHKDLQVEIRFPAEWKPESYDKERFKGDDGNVFMMDSGSTDALDACKSGATHKLKPFGSSPRIQRLKVVGRNACVVWPSKDQIPSASTRLEAMLAIELPAPVKENQDFCWVAEIYGDQDHILAIANTIRFLSKSKIPPPVISRFVPAGGGESERDLDFDNDGVPEIAIRYVIDGLDGMQSENLKVLRYDAVSGWSEAFKEEVSGVEPNFLNVWEVVTRADGKQGLLNTISMKGTQNVSLWYVLASVNGKIVKLEPPSERAKVLEANGYPGRLAQVVVPQGELLIEEFVRNKTGFSWKPPNLALKYRFSGSAIEFVSVEKH